MKTKYLLSALIVAVILAAGCANYGGTSSTTAPAPPPAGAKIVEITSEGFNPATIAINAGETVAWVNKDTVARQPASAPHPAHTDYPGFDAGSGLNTGEVYAFTFNNKGEWKYHDHLNCCTDAKFFGTVIVK